jgi:regulator of protease activity HflC (stomatin/prohibitin superfamily)
MSHGAVGSSAGNKLVCVLLSVFTLGVRRFFSVPQGYARIVTAFGKFIRAAQPGLNSCLSLWGLYQRPGMLVPIMEQVREYPKENVFTRDGVGCTIDVVVFFTIREPGKAVFEVEDYETAIRNLIQATLRNECGNLATRELLAGREKLAQRLKESLEKDTAPWGISVRLVELTGIEMTANN